MFLKNYYPNLSYKYNKIKFKGFSYNSRLIKKNFIFFAIKGNNANGNNYISNAISNGAKIIISDKFKTSYKNNILFIHNKNPREILAKFSANFYKKKPLNIIAVTGTNGKSSVLNFYYQILKSCNKKVGTIGTLGIKGLNYKKEILNTTADPINLNKKLKKFYEKKINNVILEASSHGLHQHRLDNIKFKTGIFTNFSRDHLDYHKSYKNYFNSKLILFRKLLINKSNIIFENEAKFSSTLKKIAKTKGFKIKAIGKKNSFLILNKHQYLNSNQKIYFKYKDKEYNFETSLIGKIQINNLLMSIAAALLSKLNIKKILKNIKKIKPLDGRLEKIGNLKNNSKVILDYAHTPEALKECINNIRDQFSNRKISLVFGCGGDRDIQKRSIMGKIANELCNKIYLTDDNPRTENPSKIRADIKKNIKTKKLIEIPSRYRAIKTAINMSESDEIIIVAGKGHENYQEYKTKKYFSDREVIINSIKNKNKTLSHDWKLNILKETISSEKLYKCKKFNYSTNSKNIKKGDIFFALKGKNFDGNKYANEAIKNGASLAIVDRYYDKSYEKKIKVKNTLNTLLKFSEKIINSSDLYSIAITGSSGKTTLKKILGETLKKFTATTFSQKSFNNKYGVPISILNINKNTKFGVFEIGMDKKGEINKLSKIVKPQVGVITNIGHAHIKNFKNIKNIAKAKSEIIDNIQRNGVVILNSDDEFFEYLSNKAKKNNLKIISFGKSNKSNVRLLGIKKINVNYYIKINFQNNYYKFKIEKELRHYTSTLLATIAILSYFFDLSLIDKNIFLGFQIPEGRGDIRNISYNNKNIKILDESYNSNPESLKFSLFKFDQIQRNNQKKILILGDMLELGTYSKKLHIKIADIINKLDIDKIYVIGNHIRLTFNKIRTQIKGRILRNKDEIYDLLKNEIKNNDFLMIKASNSTGLNKITKNIKSEKNNAL